VPFYIPESLREDLLTCKVEKKLLKEAMDTEQTQLKMKVTQLELTNADLEQTVAQLKKEKLEVESEKDTLISEEAAKDQLGKILIQQKQTEANKLADALKQKASELCKARLSEGRLQIEVNQLKTEVDDYKEKLEFCIVGYQKKFEQADNERRMFKHDSERYLEIKALFERLVDEDDEFCQNSLSSDTSANLDDLEKFEMIKNLLEEAYTEKKSHVSELMTLMTTAEAASVSSKMLVQDLTSQKEALSQMLADMRSEIVDSEKDNAEAKAVIKHLKEELQEIDKAATTLHEQNELADRRAKNLEVQVSSLTKALTGLRAEVLELEKISEGLQQSNDALNKDLKDRDERIGSLNEEVENLKSREDDLSHNALMLQKANDMLNQDLIGRDNHIRSLFEQVENLKNQNASAIQRTYDLFNRDLKDKDEVIGSLKAEVDNLKRRSEDDLAERAAALHKIEKKYQFLLTKERSSLAAIAELKAAIEEKGQSIQRLQSQIRHLKEASRLTSSE